MYGDYNCHHYDKTNIYTMSAKLFHNSLKFTTDLSLITLLKYEFYCQVF